MNYIMLFRSNNGLIKININDFINDKEYYKCLQYNIINKYAHHTFPIYVNFGHKSTPIRRKILAE